MFEINTKAWDAIKNYEDNKEYDEELELLKSQTRTQRIREMNDKLKGKKCLVCNSEIHVEIWSTTQAAPRYCHRLSCKSEGKRRTNKKSREAK
jgi:hypothetical protein